MSVEKLKRIVSQLRHEDLRWDAILELKVLNESSIVELLIHYLNDRDWVVRWCVAEKLAEMREMSAVPAVMKLLYDKDFHVRRSVAKAIRKYGNVAIPGLLGQIKGFDHDVRKQVSKIIIDMRGDAVDVLETEIRRSDWVTSNYVAYILWRIGGEQAEDVLLANIENKKMQKSIIVMLAWMKSKRAISSYLKIIDSPGVTRVILAALKIMGINETFPVIIKAISHNNQVVAEKAVKLMLKIGRPILPYLVRGLANPENNRKLMLRIIEKIGPELIMNDIHIFAEKN